MEPKKYKTAMLNLYRKHSRLMLEYAACTKRDENIEIKRTILKRMRDVEIEIENLHSKRIVFQIEKR